MTTPTDLLTTFDPGYCTHRSWSLHIHLIFAPNMFWSLNLIAKPITAGTDFLKTLSVGPVHHTQRSYSLHSLAMVGHYNKMLHKASTPTCRGTSVFTQETQHLQIGRGCLTFWSTKSGTLRVIQKKRYSYRSWKVILVTTRRGRKTTLHLSHTHF